MTTATERAIKRNVLKIKGNQWCRLEVELRDGRLSICGSAGRIMKPAAARQEALESWISYFDDDRGAIQEMNDRCGTRFTSSKGAARYVIEQDGEYHGLDVDHETDGKVYITESCGQIRDELAQWFPEATPFFRWHLNDMRAGSPAQQAWLEAHKDQLVPGEGYRSIVQRLTEAGLNPDPETGYTYGSAWLKEELPAEVIAWVESLKGGAA